MTDDRLYGTEGAEELCDELEDVLDEVEGWDGGTLVVYEWTVHPPEYHLPTAEKIVEDILDWTAEFGEVTEGWGDWGADNPAVLAAAEALRQAIADTVSCRMADKHVATWDVKWWLHPDDDGTIQHEARKR